MNENEREVKKKKEMTRTNNVWDQKCKKPAYLEEQIA